MLEGVARVMGASSDPDADSDILLLNAQFYGINEGTQPLMFGDPSTGKFGTYFIQDGKVCCCMAL